MSVSNINPNRDYPGHGYLAENTRLTAHLVMTWVFTAILCFLLYRDWAAFARYRVTDRAFKNHVQNYSVLVMDCPVDVTDSCAEAEKKVTTYFNRMCVTLHTPPIVILDLTLRSGSPARFAPCRWCGTRPRSASRLCCTTRR